MRLKKYLNTIRKLYLRNQIILSDLNRKAEPNTINLNWWKFRGPVQNIGDCLSPIVIDYMKQRNHISDNLQLTRTSHLYGIGSIIDGGYQDATIWGSGLINGDRKLWWKPFRKLDIRCVRGPETRRILLKNGYDCPESYGDPAILLPLIYKPESFEKKYDFKVIPHYIYNIKTPFTLSPLTSDWKSFIDDLVQSRLIISNSLHGIILAESYGIPAILLKHNMSSFKYKDYYYSTGRFDFPVSDSVEHALTITPPPIPDFQPLQQNLINTFPTDLWNSKSI